MKDWEIKGRFMNSSTVNDKLASVYLMMGAGVALAAGTAYLTIQTSWLMSAIRGWGAIALVLAQLGMVLFLGRAMEKWGEATGRLWFYIIAATMGLTMAPAISHYSAASVSQSFGLACLTLFIASAYGYTTKKSLDSMGKFMVVGLIGIIIAAIINIFLRNPLMQMVVDVLAVVIFTGLAAWDMQRVRNALLEATPEEAGKIVVMGALSMWLNIVNLFQAFLSLTGEKD